METNLALISAKPALGVVISPLNPSILPTKQCFGLPLLSRNSTWVVSNSGPRSRRTNLFAFSTPNSRRKLSQNGDNNNNNRKRHNKTVELFASTSTKGSSRTTEETTSVGVNPQPYAPPPPSQIGSPLFWIGVGVGFSALFSFVASRVKQYAMQQAFKTMMGQIGPQNSQSPFGFPPPYTPGPTPSSGFPYPPPPASVLSSSSGFPYQLPSTPGPSASPVSAASSTLSEATTTAPATASVASESTVAADASAFKVEAVGPEVVKNETEVKTEAKKSAFVDVSLEETLLKSPFEDLNGSPSPTVSPAEVVQNGVSVEQGTTSKEDKDSEKQGSLLSVDTLEKMLEDPTVQKMVYPHLPEEMRNPATFKWMLQNPVYRQQLQDMLDNMGGNPEWDSRMVDTLKNFDLNSPEVRQQFDQLGVTPEEVITKIMSNPDLAKGFQNPRVQQAMMECSQNPWNIAKYQNDKEVMDVITQLSQLFPQGGQPPF